MKGTRFPNHCVRALQPNTGTEVLCEQEVNIFPTKPVIEIFELYVLAIGVTWLPYYMYSRPPAPTEDVICSWDKQLFFKNKLLKILPFPPRSTYL